MKLAQGIITLVNTGLIFSGLLFLLFARFIDNNELYAFYDLY